MPSKLGFIARLWYYFRIGYSTYLTFLLGALNTLIVVWYLAVQQVPDIQSIFGHFVPFAVAASAVGIPLSVMIGWFHLKKTPAFSSEMDISVEANPYYYKLPPGFWKEALAPAYLEVLLLMERLLTSQKLLSPEDRARIEDLERKLRLLIDGGLLGTPRTRI